MCRSSTFVERERQPVFDVQTYRLYEAVLRAAVEELDCHRTLSDAAGRR